MHIGQKTPMQSISPNRSIKNTENSKKGDQSSRNIGQIPIRIVSSDEYAKNKVLQLQEELLKTKRECSNMEGGFGKERNNWLMKIEMLTLQNSELKQRQSNLIQINQTLELALQTKQQRDCFSQRQEGDQQYNAKIKTLKQQKKIIQKLKDNLAQSQIHLQEITSRKNQQIEQLKESNQNLANQLRQQTKRIEKSLQSLPFNRQFKQPILRALNLKQNKENSNFLSNNNYQFDCIAIDDSLIQRNSKTKKNQPTKISETGKLRLSSHSIKKQMNLQKLMISQSSIAEQDQPDQLLCQICKKIFYQRDFINHMQQCSQLLQMHKKKQMLEKAIYDLNKDQRRSVSRGKRTTNLQQMTVKEMEDSDNWGDSILKKGSNYSKQSMDQMKAIVNQLNKNNYRSGRGY